MQPELGTRVALPEVSTTWDPIARWRELYRWRWRVKEHINVLEARTGLSGLTATTADPAGWGTRRLIMSDSQVTVGAFAEGRSSRPVLNHLCRKVAATCLSCRVRVAWRYIRTHRNHADGPSRGKPLGYVAAAQPVLALPPAFAKASG